MYINFANSKVTAMEQDMKYIYQVYQDGSFSAAAEHLYMSQPALSIAVKRVEEAIAPCLIVILAREIAVEELLEAVNLLNSCRTRFGNASRCALRAALAVGLMSPGTGISHWYVQTFTSSSASPQDSRPNTSAIVPSSGSMSDKFCTIVCLMELAKIRRL